MSGVPLETVSIGRPEPSFDESIDDPGGQGISVK
jgi:hypothetical protein